MTPRPAGVRWRVPLIKLRNAVAIALFAAASPAAAQSVEEFYKGKTIQVQIGYGVGGTDDVWARVMSRYMPEFMPGSPSFVPSNVPGAGSLLLTNQLYNIAPKDGTVIGLFNRGVPFEPLLGGQSLRFEAAKFNFIGSPDRDTVVCVARSDAPVRTLEDLKTKELIVGSTGSGADSQTYPEVTARLLGVKLKLVQGYPGSRDILLAIERKEVQGGCLSYDTIARDQNYRDKKLVIVFQAGLKSDERIPEIPLITDLARTNEERQALALFFQRSLVGRPFAAPPGVPPARVEALRKAFAAALNSPALKEEAKQVGLNIHYVSPDELQKIIADAYAAPADVVALTKKAFGR